MKARRGQVALYLVAILVAITLFALMDVFIFLAVRTKNHAMNAGDSAALTVAQYQGELLNRIGSLNIEHLTAALEDNTNRCNEIVQEQARLCFLEPLRGISLGNSAAQNNYAEPNEDMLDILKDHVIDIRTKYMEYPEAYPEPWEGAWEEYAARLETEIGNGLWAGPDNMDFMDALTGHLLLTPSFYFAVDGKSWCWFHFNAAGLLDSYSTYKDWGPLPFSDPESRGRKCINSEVYSLHLNLRQGSAIQLLGTNLIVQLLKDENAAQLARLAKSELIRDPGQLWFFYDQTGAWQQYWSEIDPDGEWKFPVMGKVKPEYDVKGCAAITRVNDWAGAAKPFGTVMNETGELDIVSALKGFVTPAFTDAKLVPLDSVGGRDLSTADPIWMEHICDHLPLYLLNGPDRLKSCWYCQQLVTWEKPTFRREGSRWLKYHSNECVRPQGSGTISGGTMHGH